LETNVVKGSINAPAAQHLGKNRHAQKNTPSNEANNPDPEQAVEEGDIHNDKTEQDSPTIVTEEARQQFTPRSRLHHKLRSNIYQPKATLKKLQQN
jgi:hypothetical protein